MIRKKIGDIKLKIVWMKEDPGMKEVISCFSGTVA